MPARESCISFTPNTPILILRPDFIRITHGDHCAASLLNLFTYLTDNELTHYREAKTRRPPWLKATYLQLEEDLCGHYSYKSIKAAVANLEALGFVIVVPLRRAEGSRFLLNIKRVQLSIDRRPVCEIGPSADVGQEINSGKFQDRIAPEIAKGEDRAGKIPRAYKEESIPEELTPTEDSSPIIPITESEKNEQTDEQAEQGSVDVEMPVYGENAAAAVRRALDREKRYKITAKEKRDLAEFAGYGAMYVSAIDRVVPEFVAWAKGYAPAKSATAILNESFSWLDRMREPPESSLDVDSVVAKIQKRMDGASNEMSRALDKLLPPQFPRAAALPSSGLPPLAERWNTIAPTHLKVEIWSSVGKVNANLQAALRDKGFTESLDKTLKWCQSVWEVGREDGYVTFSWFIKPGVYMEILNHGHDWLLRPEKAANGIAAAPSCDTSGGLER